MNHHAQSPPLQVATIALLAGVCLLISPTAAALAEEDAAKTETASEASSGDDKTKLDSKFDFTLEDLGDGARVDADGNRRPHNYQYCVPKESEAIVMVGNTDPLGQIKPRDKGKVGCGEDELLATGNTGQMNYLVVLRALAASDFVKKIILVDTP
jgi:hypothetical protein